jgi:cysteinyl-tRNA synthetase
MQLYNTLTRRKELFQPVRPGKVGMYACGITAYDYCHIGHARSAVVFDVMTRYLRHLGYEVVFVRNFTDVDDKIIARALKEGRSCEETASTYIAAFHADMDRLNVLRADREPRATECVPDMLELCRRLLADGHAYAVSSGDVYFRVRSFPEYGKLSGRDVDDLRAGARVTPGEEKEDPLDFALWKAAKPGEPSWESPWGKGRPGWHLECSAMSEKNLALPMDIHGGGQDLIFPHHENEIAQSEAALGGELARYWVHNGFVQLNAEKMSKSLGNFTTIRAILETNHPETLRFFLLSKHYRSPVDFAPDSTADAERGLKRVYECLAEAGAARAGNFRKPGALPPDVSREFATLNQAFFDAMDDDCNTAAAIGHIFGMVRLVNRVLEDRGLRGRESVGALLGDLFVAVSRWSAILGLFGLEPGTFLKELRDIRARREGLDTAEIDILLARRAEARSRRDFAGADAVRDELVALGVEVRDTPAGQVWEIV